MTADERAALMAEAQLQDALAILRRAENRLLNTQWRDQVNTVRCLLDSVLMELERTNDPKRRKEATK